MGRFVGAISLCCLPLLSACNKTDSAPLESQANLGGVAVIDLDEVARQLGREAHIKQVLVQSEASLNRQLETLRISYLEQVNQRKQSLTETPESGDPAEVQALETQAVGRMQQARVQAQESINAQRRDLIAGFREEVKPVATQVAAARGLSVVVSRNESFLFSFDTAVDITTDVVAQMRGNAPAAPAVSHAAAPPLPATGGPISGQPISNQALGSNDLEEPGLLPQVPQRPLRNE